MKWQKPNDFEIAGSLLLMGPLLFCIAKRLWELLI